MKCKFIIHSWLHMHCMQKSAQKVCKFLLKRDLLHYIMIHSTKKPCSLYCLSSYQGRGHKLNKAGTISYIWVISDSTVYNTYVKSWQCEMQVSKLLDERELFIVIPSAFSMNKIMTMNLALYSFSITGIQISRDGQKAQWFNKQNLIYLGVQHFTCIVMH